MRWNIIFVWQVRKWLILRFELLDLLRSVSVVSLFPWRFVGSVLIVAWGAVHVVTSRSALVLFLSAPSPNVGLEILSHSCHITLSIYICLLLEKNFKKNKQKPRSESTYKMKENIYTYIYTYMNKIGKKKKSKYGGVQGQERVQESWTWIWLETEWQGGAERLHWWACCCWSYYMEYQPLFWHRHRRYYSQENPQNSSKKHTPFSSLSNFIFVSPLNEIFSSTKQYIS